MQKAQRLALIGMMDRHSGHCLVVGETTAFFEVFSFIFYIGFIIKMKTTSAIVTKFISALTNKPTVTTLPLIV